MPVDVHISHDLPVVLLPMVRLTRDEDPLLVFGWDAVAIQFKRFTFIVPDTPVYFKGLPPEPGEYLAEIGHVDLKSGTITVIPKT